MKKILGLSFVLFGFLLFWIIEPFNNSPFYQPSLAAVKNADNFRCEAIKPNLEDKLGLVIQDAMLSDEFLGASTGFFNQDCHFLTASLGYSNKSSLVEFKPNTINRIASITKPMTAVAIMQLYEKGKINLDASIQTYLPNFPATSKPVTIRQLLNHTSGMPHYSSKFDAMSFSHYVSLEGAVDTIYERGFVSSPGEKFVYSSFGYTLLGLVIENVTEGSFEDYLTKNIWEKAGMGNTSLETSHLKNNKSRLYIKLGGVFVRSPYTDLSIIYPAGGVQSTVEDLLRFGKAIIENKLITRTSLEIMIDTSESLAPSVGDDPYGLGWSVYHHPEYGKIISHGGAQPGVSAHFQILIDQGVASAALSNAFGTKNSVRNLAFDMADLAMSIQ